MAVTSPREQFLSDLPVLSFLALPRHVQAAGDLAWMSRQHRSLTQSQGLAMFLGHQRL